MTAMDDLPIDRTRGLLQAMLALATALAAGEPWPTATASWRPGPKPMGPARGARARCRDAPLLARRDRAILDAEGRRAGFGRLEADDMRVAIIGREPPVLRAEILGRVDRRASRLAAPAALDGAEPLRAPRDPRRLSPVPDIAERLVVGQSRARHEFGSSSARCLSPPRDRVRRGPGAWLFDRPGCRVPIQPVSLHATCSPRALGPSSVVAAVGLARLPVKTPPR